MTRYIQTMKMYVLNKIVKNKAKEATLTYSTFEVAPVSKFPCPKSIVLFFSMIKLSRLNPKYHRHYINTRKPFGYIMVYVF